MCICIYNYVVFRYWRGLVCNGQVRWVIDQRQLELSLINSSINLSDEDIVVCWGSFEIPLYGDDLYQIGVRKMFQFKRPRISDSSIAAAVFDVDKCRFKIIIRNADIGGQDYPVQFGLKFGNFNHIYYVSKQQYGNVPRHLLARKADINGDVMVDMNDFMRLGSFWMESSEVK